VKPFARKASRSMSYELTRNIASATISQYFKTLLRMHSPATAGKLSVRRAGTPFAVLA
jgi:hypothetical protein